MKQIIAWVPDDKKAQLIEKNKQYNLPIIFVDCFEELKENITDFVIFYPPLVVYNDDFIELAKKYPPRTFHAICNHYVFSYDETMLLINNEDLFPDNPDVPEELFERFLKMNIR